MSTNSKQNVITAVAIIVALIAVVYAFVIQTKTPSTDMVAEENAAAESVAEENYEEGEQNPVVMTIDGRDVTRMEVMDNFASSGSQLPQGADMEQIFPLLQEQYLISYLLDNAARNSGVNGTDPEVAKRIEEARQQAIRAVYIDQVSEEGVTDADIRQAYDDIIGNSEPVMERRARHILVDSEAKAMDIITQLQNGANFEDLARDNSTGPSSQTGGDLGYFAASEMVPAFAQSAFTMNVGDVSSTPVKTQFGYHVIKVEDERERAKPTFEEMKEQLAQQLRQGVIRKKIEDLRTTSNVMVYDYNGNPVVRPEAEEAGAPVADGSDTPVTTEGAEEQSGAVAPAPSPADNAGETDATTEE